MSVGDQRQATAATCVIIRPDYRSGGRCALPRLAAGVEELVKLLADHDIVVRRPPVEQVTDALQAIKGAGGDGRFSCTSAAMGSSRRVITSPCSMPPQPRQTR
jgi:hypothetical protein